MSIGQNKETHRLDLTAAPAAVIITGDPGRVRLFQPLLEESAVRMIGPVNCWMTGRYRGRSIRVCSTGIGSPATALCVTSLIALGTKLIIRLGSAGGMRAGQKLGEFVIPTGAIRDEGASSAYAGLSYPAVASHSIVSALVAAGGNRPGCRTGVIWSTDAFYPPEKTISRWFNRTEAIEMECATLFVLASMAGIQSGALLVLDGNCTEGILKEKFQRPEIFAQAMETAIRVVLEAAAACYPDPRCSGGSNP